MDANKEFESVKTLCGVAELHQECGKPVVLLPGFRFKSGGKDLSMDLLLHPSAHTGYVTRLFFREKVAGKGRNWTQHQVLGSNWWAPSWQGVKAEQAWPAILCAHLRGVA